ncbi:hypothetical protein KEJ49_04640, partial [Candidatus Bathyarchaeota archaeon]|nr:hypothetical protein [Candidatus Bathyarchaeota archaeon]
MIRRPYTPRSQLIEGRFNAILKLEAEVPPNSYIFTWSGWPKPPSLEQLVEDIKRMARSGRVHPRELEALYSSYTKPIRIKRPEMERGPPSYDGVKYISGSSIRGALRSRIEYKFAPKIVRGLYMSRACYIIQGDAGKGRHVDFWGVDEAHRRERLCSGEEGEVCIVC